MYDPNTADDEDWKRWLGGLMNDDVENEDEADDDDDPEYNFLEDLDEPDTEDFRNDRAVRITKKEVNELMEELFETFQDEIGFPNVEDDGMEDEEGTAEARPNFNTPQVLRFEEPLANLLNEQHRTVKEQLEQLRVKKSSIKLPQEMERSKLRNEKAAQTLALDAGQRKRLQQQMQQHVQLLTQVHLLSSCNPSLSSEASTARLFLNELESFAKSSLLLSQPSSPGFQTSFQPFNLKESLRLIKDFHAHVKIEWSPRKAVKKNMTDFACLPKQVAWILATRRVFLYPELLPTCSFKAKTPRDKIVFTKGEDNLLALGLKHFEGTDFPKPLISKYLLTTKTAHQLTGRIKNRNMNRVPDNIIRYYKTTKQLPVLPHLCEEVQPGDWKPPVEQEEQRLPFWLKASMPSIQETIEQQRAKAASQGPDADPKAGSQAADPTNPEAPLHMPEGLQLILRPLSSRFCRRIWRWQRPAAGKPFLVQPSLCLPPAGTGGFIKMSAKQPLPAAVPSKLATRVSPLSQPASQPHLNLPSTLSQGAPYELQGVLPARPSPLRMRLAPAVPANVVSSLPVAFHPKMILPALPANHARKSPLPRGYQKKKAPKVAPLLKAAPLLHPTPVIFTVPAGTVKVLGIANSCNVLQPLSATRAVSAPQPIPITTLLVNPAPFSCPLSQPLAASPALPLVVASNSSPTTPSALVKDSDKSTSPLNVASAGDAPEPKTGPEEAPRGPWSSDLNSAVRTEPPTQGYVEAAEVLAPAPFSPTAELGGLVKVDLEASKETSSLDAAAAPPIPTPENSPMKEELILDLGEGLEVETTSGVRKEPEDVQKEPGCEEEEEEEEEETDNSTGNSTGPQVATATDEGRRASPTNLGGRSPALDTGSSLGKAEEMGNQPEGAATAGQEGGGGGGGGEKDGMEEEEEEDFDDYIQDEEDEMSSASEESVLSVPELQVRPGRGSLNCLDPYLGSLRRDWNGIRLPVDLYARLRVILQDWPQLLTDFAAFLLPEQALECGLFEEQQAFEKSRTFLRRLEICFAENPSHHQKIIKVLQNCADCVPQEIMELKNQMWQLLKGHDHLQDEFSVFFDHLRPSASRLGDFEEINWTEEKEYEFDGFEEVSLPDMEEDEEPPKIHAASKNKRRKELGSQQAEKVKIQPPLFVSKAPNIARNVA
ncbi:PREDICTED: GON-4-like protein [Thamnophis sirtalis]|uniref:GON-4-like protein n=1 Tax=Thamnophis sirtalis TaxID=35019 RepID=A0A6I9Y1Z4_9SAUR|nr:PREDICTED: GON-4-like protein [Thamnophis sirtalis]